MPDTAHFESRPPLSPIARWALLGFGAFNFALGAVGLVIRF